MDLHHRMKGGVFYHGEGFIISRSLLSRKTKLSAHFWTWGWIYKSHIQTFKRRVNMIMKLIVLIRPNSMMRCNISKNYVAISKDIKILKLWLWWSLSLISLLHKNIPVLIPVESFAVRISERTRIIAIIETTKMIAEIVFSNFFLPSALALNDHVLFINSCSA